MKFDNNIEKLRYFYIVSEYKSFSKAAIQLNINQSTISRNIASLENELGAQLFIRKTYNVELTQQGHQLLKSVKTIFAELASISDFAQVDSFSQKLRVVGGENALTSILIASLNEFYSKHPGIILDIGSSHEIPEFSKHELQVGITGYIENNINLVQINIATFNLGLFASQQYLKLKGIPESIKDLDHHDLIVFENNNIPFYYPDNWILTIGRGNNNLRKPYLIINSVPMSFNATKLGLGLTVLAKESLYLDDSNLIEVLPSIKSPQLKIYYSYHNHYKNNKTIITLEKHLIDYCNKKGWS